MSDIDKMMKEFLADPLKREAAILASYGAQTQLLMDLLAWPCEGHDCNHDLRHVDANHHEDGDGSGTWHCGHCWDKALTLRKKHVIDTLRKMSETFDPKDFSTFDELADVLEENLKGTT